jgi:hypothetical protein
MAFLIFSRTKFYTHEIYTSNPVDFIVDDILSDPRPDPQWLWAKSVGGPNSEVG